MSGIYLAAPWMPRGELNRLRRYFDRVSAIYHGVVVALPLPSHEECDQETDFLRDAGVKTGHFSRRSGRHVTVQMALEAGADHIHYVDMDRLVRWIELRPDELAATAKRIETTDCLLIGRTPVAYATHSRTLIDTERLTNGFFSHWLKSHRPGFAPEYPVLDLSAGSRGFSRRAAEFILKYDTSTGNETETNYGNALAMDGGWLALLERGGFDFGYVEVDGLDWETADRYRDMAATADQQRELAEKVDADPAEWALRVRVARELMDYGLAAISQELDN